jgi:hypothetical protein
VIADNTNPIKLLAIVLITAGALGLAYGGFDYTRGRNTTKIGPIDISVRDERHVTIPIWAGAATLAVGVVLLVFPVRRS